MILIRKFTRYLDLSVIGTFEEALKNFAALDSFGVLANIENLELGKFLVL